MAGQVCFETLFYHARGYVIADFPQIPHAVSSFPIPGALRGLSDPLDGDRVSWLIEPDFAPARQSERRETAPTLLAHGIAGDALFGQAADLGGEVVCHQIKFMHVVF